MQQAQNTVKIAAAFSGDLDLERAFMNAKTFFAMQQKQARAKRNSQINAARELIKNELWYDYNTSTKEYVKVSCPECGSINNLSHISSKNKKFFCRNCGYVEE